jgi:biotin synthase-related radical SAM superfamily protein
MGEIFGTDINIKCSVKLGENATDIYEILQQVYSKGTVTKHIFLFMVKISRWKGKYYRVQKI